jgi:hypothetical protein
MLKEKASQFESLSINSNNRSNQTELGIRASFAEYDKLIAGAYERALEHVDWEAPDFGLSLIPEDVREERIKSLVLKIGEYENRLNTFYTLLRPMYLAPEQMMPAMYGERVRRGMLKMITEKGQMNTYLYYQALQEVEDGVFMNQFLGSIDVIHDYLVNGTTDFAGSTGLPE